MMAKFAKHVYLFLSFWLRPFTSDEGDRGIWMPAATAWEVTRGLAEL